MSQKPDLLDVAAGISRTHAEEFRAEEVKRAARGAGSDAIRSPTPLSGCESRATPS
jgi:hypothetical protein